MVASRANHNVLRVKLKEHHTFNADLELESCLIS